MKLAFSVPRRLGRYVGWCISQCIGRLRSRRTAVCLPSDQGSRGSVALLLAVALIPSLGIAQDPAPDRVAADGSISESLVVRETTIHVRVRTPRKAIESLSQDRFKVLMGDRELPILAFEELSSDGEGSSADGASTSESLADPADSQPDAAGGRSLLFVFDLFWTPKRSRRPEET